MISNDYPCCICNNFCEDDSIECIKCTNWVHFDCVPLTKTDIAKFTSDDDLDFTCRNCVFDNTDSTYEKYNFTFALTRIRSACGDVKQQQKIAKEISLELDIYQVSMPPFADSFDGLYDEVSKDLLRQFNPVTLRQYSPIKTLGDGNCFYRSFSRIFFSSEKHHLELRLRTLLEILNNPDYYDSSSSSFKDQINDPVIVTSSYEDLIKSTCTVGAYSEMLHFYALSAATRLMLQSYYPPTDPCGVYAGTFTRKIIGRGSRPFPHGTPIVMWTQTYVPNRATNFRPNHFVPLRLNTQSSEPTSTYIGSSDEDENNDDIDDILARNPFTSDPDKFVEMKRENLLNEETLPCHDSLHKEERTTDKQDCNIEGPGMGILTDAKFLNIQDVLKILTETEMEYSIDQVPVGHKSNVYFVLNNAKNMQRKEQGDSNLFWDDCGSWTGSRGKAKSYFMYDNGKLKTLVLRGDLFCVEKQVRSKRVYEALNPQPPKEDLLILNRLYSTLKDCTTYKRRVSVIEHFPSELPRIYGHLALVEYIGKYPGRPQHGNSKSNQPYRRTVPDVLTTLRNMTENLTPRNVYDSIHHTTEDPLMLPRSMEQVKNMRRNVTAKKTEKTQVCTGNFADNVLNICSMVSDHPFIQRVLLTKNKVPSVICYTDEQVQDLKRFCAKPNGTIWGFDKTFNLGDVYVTASVFKHLAVYQRNTDDHPVFIGPVFFHGNSDFETYTGFFSRLATFFTDEELSHIVIGTDDEKALRKAVKRNFPSATNLVCTRHLKNNVKDYLVKNVTSDDSLRRDIIASIFGSNGITSAEDEDVLNYRVHSAIDVWRQVAPTFVEYFKTRLLPILVQSVCVPQQIRNVDNQWTNNNCESINHVLKVKTNWKQLKLTDLILRVYEYVNARYQDLKRALCNEGSFCLSEAFEHHQVSADVWYLKSSEGRSKAFAAFLKDQGKLPNNRITSKGGSLTVPIKASKSKKPNQVKRSISERTKSKPKRKKIDSDPTSNT